MNMSLLASDGTPKMVRELPGVYMYTGDSDKEQWRVRIWRSGDPDLSRIGSTVRDGDYILSALGMGAYPKHYVMVYSPEDFHKIFVKVE